MCVCVRGKFRIYVFKAGVKYSHDSALNGKHSKQNAKLFSNISGMISDLELFELKVQKNRPPASSYTQGGIPCGGESRWRCAAYGGRSGNQKGTSEYASL